MRPSTERLTGPGRGAWGRMLWIGAALFAAGAAQASLQGRDADGNAANGFEAYYDNVLGITWLADANHAYSSGQAAGSFGATAGIVFVIALPALALAFCSKCFFTASRIICCFRSFWNFCL